MIFGKSINKYYLKYAHFFILGVIALIIVDLFQLEIPLITRTLVNTLEERALSGDTDRTFLIDIIKNLAFITIFIVLGRFFWRFGIIGASRRIDYDLRNEMFDHTTKLSNRFYSEKKVGGLMAHFTNDLEAVRRAIGPGMVMFVDALFLGTLTFYRMAQLDLRMTLILVLPLVLISTLGMILGNRMRRRFKASQKAFEDLSDFTQESFSGISVIKAFVKERNEIKAFLRANKNAKDKNIAFVRMATILQVLVGLIVSLVFVLIIAYGANLIDTTRDLGADRFTPGDLVAFISYFGMLIWPMMALSMIINVRSQGKASLERINKILDEPIDIQDKDVIDIEEIQGDIEFRNLNFRYPDGEENVLKDVSFKIKKGQTVGILGRTGSGKTSVVDLLLRIYNVEENQLLIDGIDIMNLPFKKVRESIGYVPQDGFLFSDTIRNNISLGIGRDDSHMDKIELVSKLSDVHDNIIQFKHGYQTIIGERGVTLSGGQKQRVSIARALAKEPPILIMDDSVSAVDTSTEEKILKNLKSIRKGKTTLMIAHRISTVKNADQIIVIDEGKIVDVGTHDQLLSRCEYYIDMVRRQQLEDEVEVA
ncbi:ABC transporter ATP-binding protein [Liberiplasma polymorphum]|uniref:ABC transporter ATP-binding protein n=1 Tax=Liberiplasma polymorphum TaxID=3374570 RepID=UPI003770C076